MSRCAWPLMGRGPVAVLQALLPSGGSTGRYGPLGVRMVPGVPTRRTRMRPTGFEPVTFGFVESRGLCRPMWGQGFKRPSLDIARLRLAGLCETSCPNPCPTTLSEPGCLTETLIARTGGSPNAQVMVGSEAGHTKAASRSRPHRVTARRDFF